LNSAGESTADRGAWRGMAPVVVGSFGVDVGALINEGGFGKVYTAHREDQPGTPYAAKRVPLTDSHAASDTKREVEVMQRLAGENGRGHSSIIRLHEFHEMQRAGRREAWLIMEMATGGELFDLLISSGRLDERTARPLVRSLIAGILYMHGLGIVHRDLKLENVMLSAEDPTNVKIIDFGLAVQLKEPPQALTGRVGSKSYRSPEILACPSYEGPPVDIWALGITAFSLLAGFFPIDEPKPSDWRYAQLASDQASGVGACESIYAMYKRPCRFSAGLKSLLDALLTIDVRQRPAVGAVAALPWLNEGKGRLDGGDAFSEQEEEEEVVYRSLGDGEADLEPLHETMMPICRQRAALHDDA